MGHHKIDRSGCSWHVELERTHKQPPFAVGSVNAGNDCRIQPVEFEDSTVVDSE